MTAGQPAPEPFAFTAPLTVCVDVKHPHTYLTLGPVRRFAAEHGVEVDWLPFPAAGLKPPPPPGDERGIRHRRLRAAYWASEIERYAGVQGIHIDDPFRSADSTLVSLAHLWLRERAPERVPDLLAAACRRHWDRSVDITDPAQVTEMLADIAGAAEAFSAFAAGPGPAALAVLRERLVAAGVFTVPSLVVDDDVFVGRAHLPMVAWILGGRQGPPPI